MNSNANSPVGTTCVVLPGACTLKEASAVKELLKDGLEATGNVELDARRIDRIDTSVLQLLASFVRDMREAGRTVVWAGANEEFNRSARLLGLETTLGVGAGG
jgi:anti-anti-sigma regulatory factor